MNKLRITFFLLFLCSTLSAQIKEDSDYLFRRTVTKWFSAWELVYKDIYGMNDIQPVDFVLFDDLYIYSTSDVSIEEGESILGANLLNLSLKWKKKAHHGTIMLPDGVSVPVGMMCFAAENPKNNHPFFVMPLTSFWVSQGIDTRNLRMEDMVTGVFLHEFSHTQQMQNFGKKINEMIKQGQLKDDIDDNLIQRTFSNDSLFITSYRKEMEYFSGTIINQQKVDSEKLKMGLKLMEDRRNQFFINQHANLSEVEDIFLTMEGLGQYSKYIWLTHEKGANIDKDAAIEGVRRNKKIWSQEQGFILFLILEKYIAPDKWAKEMFGTNLIYITDLLKK